MASPATGTAHDTGSTTGPSTSRHRWRWPPSLAGVLGAGFVVWALIVGLGRLGDNSFFTHLATGRLILDEGIPTRDPYSFTAPGEPWVVQSWLASLVYGLVDRAVGPVGLRLLTGLLTATIAALAWRLTRPAVTLVPRIAVTGFVVAVGGTFWAPRPLLFGLVGMGVALVVVQERLDPRWLAPLLWLWVQVHGSWPLGLVAIACLAAGRRADGEHPDVELRALAWAVGGAVVGGIVNPLGPRLLVFPVGLLSRSEVLSQVIEWQSPDFGDAWARLFLLQVVVAVLALVRRPSYRSAVPLVVFTAAALLGLRNVPVASLVLVPGMAAGLADLGSLRGRERNGVTVALAGAVAVIGIVGVTATLSRPHYDLESFPVDALAWASANGLVDPEVRVLTEETAGNYLHLAEGPDGVRVFIDDRVDMYPPEVIDDYVTVLRGRSGWDATLEQWGIEAVVWPRNEPLAQLLVDDPGWVTVYQDPRWFVACRRDAASCPSTGSTGP